jgi:integrase
MKAEVIPFNEPHSLTSLAVRSPAGLSTLRFHDLRHAAITNVAKSRASDQTIVSIAGHVSQKMLEHYCHIRMAAERSAVDAI